MATSLPLPELIFVSPKRLLSPYSPRCSVYRIPLSRTRRFGVLLRTKLRAVREDGVVAEERENELIKEVNGYGLGSNGAAYNANGDYRYNGWVNGGVTAVESESGGSNGTLVKYVNGNGVAATVVGEIQASESVEEGRKKRVEEIGKEEAWFKQSDQQQIEVSVAPGGRWNRFKTYSTIQRTLEIWGFVFNFIIKAWLNNQKFTYRGGMTEEKKVARRKILAKWLKENILRLGPTFIKIGQQFSTRVDILPQEYVDQLSELQDQVPPFPSETAISIVEEELGGPVANIFERFDQEPIAAASLGQVHRARLKGQEVVVKVQRPSLKELFDIDLKNLRVIAEYLQKLDPKSDGAKRDWVAIYDECANVLYQEIDYTKEAANAERFSSNFRNLDYVKVPSIYWDYTTPQVLTMEYVPGIKINKIKALDQLGIDRKRLGRYAVESYLEQILSHGFFHADPHPGNIAVDDVNGGRLIFYDFGMMGRDSRVDKLKSQIFILSCTQRRAALKQLKIDRVKKYEYCLPYFYQPFKEDELEQSTQVQIIFPAEPKPIFCEFDWDLDELQEFTDKLTEEEELSEDQKDTFKEFVREKVREAKKANRETREARKKVLQEMSEETKAAFEKMRFYKFYPVQTQDSPDISNVKARFINRYYGKAHEIL